MENPSQIHHGHDHEHHHEQKHDGEHDQQHHQGHEHQHHHAHDHLHGVGDSDGFWVGKDGKRYHSHDGLAPHTHESLDSPGYFTRRAKRLANRDFKERAFTVGIGGPVGSGKTALMLALCTALRDKYSIAAEKVLKLVAAYI